MENLQAYLNEIYTQSPYALSSELQEDQQECSEI